MLSIAYLWNLKNDTNEQICKIEMDSWMWETKGAVSSGEKGGERNKKGVWD